MKKGEIWLADLNPRRGKQQRGARPIVIISGNVMNDNFDLVITCPLSSAIKNFVGGIVLKPNKANGLKINSEILTFNIRSISKNRLVKKLGSISSDEMDQLIQNLNKILKN